MSFFNHNTASSKIHSECLNIKNNGKNDDSSEENSEKTINLNDFLDFLNLSCHVNDMISQNVNSEQAASTAKIQNSGAAGSSRSVNRLKNRTHSPLEFELLRHNRLLNELYGYNSNIKSKIEENNDSAGSNNLVAVDGANKKSVCSRGVSTTTISTLKTTDVPSGVLHPKLNEKLNHVLNEGILDAVLPYICPVPLPSNYTNRLKPKDPVQKTSTSSVTTLTSSVVETPNNLIECTATAAKEQLTKTASKLSLSRKKPSIISIRDTEQIINNVSSEKKESHTSPDVVIHITVCDEVKNISKDFTCPQSLLVGKMGYFADVTAGQKLQDMDISVHCDIQIFDWLMKWVKSGGSADHQNLEGPQLNAHNVVPILVSASFLQMEPLLLDCLSYCHSHLSEVVKYTTNLSCLNDAIITRLAAMFTNVELEMVRDKKDRLLPRLWIKMIQSLCEPEPEALRGHYYSLAGLFKCAKCNKCLTNTMKTYVECAAGNVRLNRWGQVVSHHVRDPAWDLGLYITQLFKELKSWRRVYYKLWGHAHYLYCCLCEMHFPVYQMSWCRYHPESPSFLGPVAEGRTTGPAGRYACCGQQAFRFETLSDPNGCQFREHSVLVETDRERSILSIMQLAAEGGALGDAPPLKLQESMSKGGENEPRWKSLSLMPQRCRQGLLPVLNPDESTTRLARRIVRAVASKFFADTSTDTESTDTLDNFRSGKSKFSSGAAYRTEFSTSSSDGCESPGTKPVIPAKSYQKKHPKKGKPIENPGRYWSGDISARSNQDNQRDYEEKVMKQVVALVQKKVGSDQSVKQNQRPLGGSYVKLEQEWREQIKQRTYASGATVTASTAQIGINLNNNSGTKSARKG